MTHEFRLLEAGDRVAGLKLGSEAFTPLKTYLQRHAKNHQSASLARSYVAVENRLGQDAPQVIGYMTLVAGEVSIEGNDDGLVDDDAEDVSYPYLQYPAVKIARLAVDSRARGRDIGRDLVSLAIAITQEEVAAAVGCRFLMVDAKTDSVAFYEKVGFTMLDTPTNRARDEKVMFIDIHKL